ncbi:hypothetical protein ACT453_48365, partial [Bacillus sp. D-CC]
FKKNSCFLKKKLWIALFDQFTVQNFDQMLQDLEMKDHAKEIFFKCYYLISNFNLSECCYESYKYQLNSITR